MPDAATGRSPAALQPPVAYLPCRLDADGQVEEVMMAQLADGRIALMGYTALDRFVAACGNAHPWVLWKTEELEALRAIKHYDVAYLDIPMPAELRIEEPSS
ncbi:SAV_915 family protein [Nocardioides sp. 616]|uniref:SAV_915 family protein n=1 Tax=Nocardioides sp. 616 TaxID=2268090 RepID=UPI001962B1C3|nr:SAV_915 family protein [Nocardioides sp. 616]